ECVPGVATPRRSVRRALAAAALQLIASDEALGLTPEQQMYMWQRAAELDLAVVEDLTGIHTMPAEDVALS
ncbi:hypothetical protein ABZ931_19815, partial [Streptomyces neyagawaensis]